MSENLYRQRDVEALDNAGNYFYAHMGAMTSEGLQSKAAIAAELGFRDMIIDKMKEIAENCCDEEMQLELESRIEVLLSGWAID